MSCSIKKRGPGSVQATFFAGKEIVWSLVVSGFLGTREIAVWCNRESPLITRSKNTPEKVQCVGRCLLLCFFYVFCPTRSLWLSSTENVDYSSCNKLVISSCCSEFKSPSVIFGVLSARKGSRRLWIILLSYPGSSNNFSVAGSCKCGLFFFYCTGY